MSKKKYMTRDEITKKIDGIKKRFEAKSIKAEEHKTEADGQFKQSAIAANKSDVGTLIKLAQENRTQEKKLLRQIKSYPAKLESLKRTLAAFDTLPMPFVDCSIVHQL